MISTPTALCLGRPLVYACFGCISIYCFPINLTDVSPAIYRDIHCDRLVLAAAAQPVFIETNNIFICAYLDLGIFELFDEIFCILERLSFIKGRTACRGDRFEIITASSLPIGCPAGHTTKTDCCYGCNIWFTNAISPLSVMFLPAIIFSCMSFLFSFVK